MLASIGEFESQTDYSHAGSDGGRSRGSRTTRLRRARMASNPGRPPRHCFRLVTFDG